MTSGPEAVPPPDPGFFLPGGFEFVDLMGRYGRRDLLSQVRAGPAPADTGPRGLREALARLVGRVRPQPARTGSRRR